MEIDTETSRHGFDDLLSAVLSEDKAIECVLDHPDFRRRAFQICQRVASSPDVDELFQDACLRILTHKSINQTHLQSSEKFLHWFYKLVSQVNRRRVSAMRTCTDPSGQWPDKSADVTPDAWNEFYRHAEECSFHREAIRSEEEELEASLTSIVGLARGFDKQGQLLNGAELQAARLEHERRMKTWNDAVLKKDYPFRQLSLCNGPREIARCGIFFDFVIHESLHDLDLKLGLQIRGIGRTNSDDEVLLGFYPLEGFQHDDDEKTLPLGNGYTVGLRIRKSEGTKYWINLRCVESEVLAAEVEEAGSDIGEDWVLIDDDAPGDRAIEIESSLVLPERETAPAVDPILLSTASRWRAVALTAMILVVVGLPASFAYGVKSRPEENTAENQPGLDMLLVMNRRLDDMFEMKPAAPPAPDTGALRDAESALRTSQQKAASQQQEIKSLQARLDQLQANKARLRQELAVLQQTLRSYELAVDWRQDRPDPTSYETEFWSSSRLARLETLRPLVLNQTGSSYLESFEGQSDSRAAYHVNSEMIRFRLNDDKSSDESNPQIVSSMTIRRTWQYQVSVHPHSADDPIAVFVGSSPEFMNELLRLSSLHVTPVTPGSQSSAFKVIWNITEKRGKIVEIQATVLHGDEFYRKFVFPRPAATVMTEGCSDSACRKFLVQAIATVYEYINPAWRNHLDAGTAPQLPRGVGPQEPLVTPREEEQDKQRDEKSGKGRGAHAD